MPDDNLDIELLIAELEISNAHRKVQDNLKKVEDLYEKQSDRINKIQAEMNEAFSKEKAKMLRNARCPPMDSNHTCFVIGLNDSFDSATKKADELTKQYENGEISKAQYLSEMTAIFDELPPDLRQRFGMFLEQERFLRVFSTIDDLSSLIPGLSGFGKSMTTAQLILTYFQSYSIGGRAAGIRSLVQALSELGFKTIMAGGIVLPLALLSGIGTIPALLLSTIIPTGILDLLKRNDK